MMVVAKTESVKSGVVLSIGLHFALVLFFSVKTLFFASEPLIIQDSLRVDLVALPDKIVAPPAPKEKLPQAKEKKVTKKPPPKKTKKINIKKAKKKQKSAFEKLKAKAAFDRLRKKKPAKEAEPTPTQKVEYKGNVLAAGTSLTGVNKLQHNRYLNSLKVHVKKNWFLPEWLANQDLSAQVELKIDKLGQLMSSKLVKSSGNVEFDELVLKTVQNSSPVPIPPEKFIAILSEDGIVLGFPR